MLKIKMELVEERGPTLVADRSRRLRSADGAKERRSHLFHLPTRLSLGPLAEVVPTSSAHT
jgi:hypothetical protein